MVPPQIGTRRIHEVPRGAARSDACSSGLNAALVSQAQNGATGALNDLFTRLLPVMRRAAEANLAPTWHSDPEDAVQDAVPRLLRGLPEFQFRGDSALLAWASQIVVSACRDLQRGQTHREHDCLGVDAEAMLGDTVVGASEYRASDEVPSVRGTEIAAAIRDLPKGQRDVIWLKLEGLTEAAIGERLGVAKGTVKSRYHYAIAAIRVFVGLARD